MKPGQTTRIAISLAVATPSILPSIPASATMAPAAWSRSADLPTADARSRLLEAMTHMSAEEKQAIGGERLILTGNIATKGKNARCATGGIWCRGGQWSNGCTCAFTRRITKKPNG
jgi:hypothetical protein